MRNVVSGAQSRLEFDSVADLVATVKKHRDIRHLRTIGMYPSYFGDDVRSVDDVLELARVGWESHLDETLKVAESTLEKVERDYDVPSWQSYYDVAGSDVDVARYLSGEPENMIAYTMVETPRTGRVVSLAVNVSVSGGVSADKVIRRGKAIVSLVYALERIGLRVELYVVATSNSVTKAKRTGCDWVRVKQAQDVLDPAMIMFALAHPSFLRALMLSAMYEHPEPWRNAFDVEGGSFGSPMSMPEMTGLPDGTVVLDTKVSIYDRDRIDSPEAFVTRHLKDLGLIS